MVKKEETKPNFLKDIDSAIKEELTSGGLNNNSVGLAGELKEIKEIATLCGLRYEGYIAKLETPRPSGALDEVVVVFKGSTAFETYGGIEFDILAEYAVGSRLLVAGKLQTLKDFESGKVLVFVLAEYIALSPKAMLQDDVAIMGELAYAPTYRETPRGKRISDIMLKVKSALTGGWCFIPCICWQETADEVATWQQGDTVEVFGRCQSREYEKVLQTLYAGGQPIEHLTETRTAYEVSVRTIERKGEAKNAE